MYCDIPLLGRCCFCLPLRRGILLFGFISIIFCISVTAIYSLHIHHGNNSKTLLYHGAVFEVMAHICVAIYVVELLMNILLIYAAYKKSVSLLKIYYYYMMTTTAATVVLQLALLPYQQYIEVEMLALCASGLFIQIYLIILVRSLLMRLQGRQPPVPCQLQGLPKNPPPESQVYSPTTEAHYDLLV